MRYSPITRSLIVAAFGMFLSGCGDGPKEPEYTIPVCSGGPERCLVFGPGWVFGVKTPVPVAPVGRPDLGVSDLSVVKLPDGRYRMYGMADEPQEPGEPYSNVRVYYSFISSDGVNYTQEPGVRLTAFGAHIGHVAMMKDGSCRMYFGFNVQGDVPITEIRSAWSADCFTFAVEPGARLTASGMGNEVSGIVGGEVIITPSGNYRMYYAGSNQAGVGRVLSATSTDGLNWTREPGVRIAMEELCAVLPGAGMVKPLYDGGALKGYIGAQRCEGQVPGQMRNLRSGIWEVTSTDGLNFEFSNTPVVSGYMTADRFMSDGITHPYIGPVDPAAVLTPNGIRVLFSIYGGPDDVLFPERGHYVMLRTQ